MFLLSLPRALAQWLFLFVCNVVLLLLGLLVVAVAIPFRVPGLSVSDGRPIVNLPRWVWLWGNDFDGLLGDKHGTWAASTPFGLPADSFIAMYTWAALRNPSTTCAACRCLLARSQTARSVAMARAMCGTSRGWAAGNS
jgi:hypothetical protein